MDQFLIEHDFRYKLKECRLNGYSLITVEEYASDIEQLLEFIREQEVRHVEELQEAKELAKDRWDADASTDAYNNGCDDGWVDGHAQGVIDGEWRIKRQVRDALGI